MWMRIKLKLGNAVLRLTLVFRKDHCYRPTCLPSTGIWRRFWRSWWWLRLTFKFYSSMRWSIGYMRQPWAAQGGNPKITSGFKVWRTDSKQKKFCHCWFQGKKEQEKSTHWDGVWRHSKSKSISVLWARIWWKVNYCCASRIHGEKDFIYHFFTSISHEKHVCRISEKYVGYIYKNALNREKLKRFGSKAFKKIVSTSSDLIRQLSGYEIEKRAEVLWTNALAKWKFF